MTQREELRARIKDMKENHTPQNYERAVAFVDFYITATVTERDQYPSDTADRQMYDVILAAMLRILKGE